MQNTSEILSHSQLYVARDDKAAEKACMKPMHCLATENTHVLKAFYKRLEAEETKMYEAKGEEAAEMRTQQECILSGGVYLHHRSRKASFPKNLSALLFPR